MEELKFNQKRGVLASKLCAEISQICWKQLIISPESIKCARLQKNFFSAFFFFFFSLSCLDTTLNKMFEYYIEKKDKK